MCCELGYRLCRVARRLAYVASQDCSNRQNLRFQQMNSSHQEAILCLKSGSEVASAVLAVILHAMMECAMMESPLHAYARRLALALSLRVNSGYRRSQ